MNKNHILKCFLFNLIFIAFCAIGFPNINNNILPDLMNVNDALKEHADNMIKFMNRTADPCEDFHQYACGNWKKYHDIPIDHEAYDVFHKLNDKLRDALHDILTTETNLINSDIEAIKTTELVRILFESCIDIDAINDRKSEPLLQFLKKIGGFPLLDENWSENDFNLEQILIELSLHGVESFFGFSVFPDLNESDKFLIYIWDIGLGLPLASDYLDEEHQLRLNAYRNYMVEIFEILNAEKGQIEKVVDEIIMLETRIINETNTRGLPLLEIYIHETIGSLKENYPKFNWSFYFNTGFGRKFDDDTKIVFFTGPNINETYNILFDTEKRIMANYLNWIAVYELVTNLDERFKPALKKFSKILDGSEPDSENRRLACTSIVNKKLGMAVGSIYIKKYFDETSKADVSKIAQKIITAFRENLYEMDWLDAETRIVAERKVNKTKLGLGYPDFLLNQTALDEYYATLNFQHGKYFENILNVRNFDKTRKFKKLEDNSCDDDEDWSESPTIANAYFENEKNRILMPASVLQPPIYHKDFPKALSYGAIGVFIGHELTHGFDSNGRLFNENGKIEDWWTNKSLESFNEREQCFIDQYDEYLLNNESLSGIITRRENIADNGGIQLAFKVYNEWLRTRKEDERKAETLPGLEFLSPEQLFFLSFAQSWCDYIRPEATQSKVYDVHPPGSTRIMGVLQNFEEFSKTFQCSEDSYMNPSKKCKLW